MSTREHPVESFDVSVSVAEVYESRFVPAIFETWAPQLVDVAGVAPGDDVLDVGCGTGIVARTAAATALPGGSVTGLDLNPAMLTVAQRIRPDLDWDLGDVAALPYADESFDAVLSQMALMFVPDVPGALRELRRVTRAGGGVGILVPAALDAQPAYQVFVDVATRHAGTEAAALLGAYWRCGDLAQLTADLAAAGLTAIASDTRSRPARFQSVADFVEIEVGGTPLAERIDRRTIGRIVEDCTTEMAPWTQPDTFDIPLVCHLVTGRRSPAEGR